MLFRIGEERHDSILASFVGNILQKKVGVGRTRVSKRAMTSQSAENDRGRDQTPDCSRIRPGEQSSLAPVLLPTLQHPWRPGKIQRNGQPMMLLHFLSYHVSFSRMELVGVCCYMEMIVKDHFFRNGKHAELNHMDTSHISAQPKKRTRMRTSAARGDMVPRKLRFNS